MALLLYQQKEKQKRNAIMVDLTDFQMQMMRTIAEVYGYTLTQVMRTLMLTDETMNTMYEKAITFKMQNKETV